MRLVNTNVCDIWLIFCTSKNVYTAVDLIADWQEKKVKLLIAQKTSHIMFSLQKRYIIIWLRIIEVALYFWGDMVYHGPCQCFKALHSYFVSLPQLWPTAQANNNYVNLQNSDRVIIDQYFFLLTLYPPLHFVFFKKSCISIFCLHIRSVIPTK